jgi:hypothetical protein
MNQERRGGIGWVITAGIVLLLAGWGLLNEGLWALHANDSIQNTVKGTLLFSDTNLDTWGWIYTIAGAIVILAALGVFFRAQWAVWTGITAASLSIAIQFLWLFTPYWPQAMVTILLDSFVIWALTAHGLNRYDYA